ncbi:unnamed protein product [Sphenostylis stenocarpa]|uniref:F-box domain-containing protein n=1 Tax=Sphenostylis stenocarpa TaxID=92480 RepID=A0AA86SI69_9FABA|nr:unnamed protein product [Sphenostylis stenocarpa]
MKVEGGSDVRIWFVQKEGREWLTRMVFLCFVFFQLLTFLVRLFFPLTHHFRNVGDGDGDGPILFIGDILHSLDHKMELLPYDCFAHILSFTSPQDACRSSLVSSIVQSMADSDTVWEKFLPFNYQEIVSRLVSPSLPCSSNKELFLLLCNPRPIDDGNKMLWIEKRSGKICYLLSARELSIAWGDSPLYWSWKPIQGSRFEEAAELRTICWLEIKGSINSGMLSPKTLYGAYLKVKTADRAYGLDLLPSEVSVEIGKHKSQGTVCIHLRRKRNMNGYFHRRVEDDEWWDIELGNFHTHSNEEVRMSLREVKGVHLKGGLILDGIEIRPKQLEKASTYGP